MPKKDTYRRFEIHSNCLHTDKNICWSVFTACMCKRISLVKGIPPSTFQSDKRSFTKDEHWAVSTRVLINPLLSQRQFELSFNELKLLIYKSVHRYHPMRLTPALGIQRCLTRLLLMLYWCSLRWNIWNWKVLERHIGEIFYHINRCIAITRCALHLRLVFNDVSLDYCSCFTGVVFGETFEIEKYWKGT